MFRRVTALRLACRSYRLLIHLLPRRYRHRHGEEVTRLFDELARDALARRGLPALLDVWLRSVFDVVRWASREHLVRRARRSILRHGKRRSSHREWTASGNRMETLLQDIRYGARSLARRPGFTAMVVATFALGIGANTAMFNVVNGVLLRDLPYRSPDRIVRLMGTDQGRVNVGGTLAWANFRDAHERSDIFSAAAAYDEWQPNLTGVGEPERLDAALVSTPFFEVLGVKPALGRFFRPEEDIDGQDRVVVLSHGLWQRKFGGDPTIIGRAIDLNGNPHTVVGVAPRDFEDPKLSGARWGEPALWRPLGFGGISGDQLPSRGSSSYVAIGRLRPGITIEQARARIAAISRQLEEEYPAENAGVGMTVVPLRESIVGEVSTSLIVLLGLVGFVLAIAASNVGNLLLGRAAERQHEMALRAALGATRRRLLRQLLTETLLLAALGGALGLGLAAVSTGMLVDLGGPFIPRSEAVRIDLAVLGFGLGVTLVTGLLCGSAPVLLLSTRDLRSALVDSSRTTGGRRSHRLRSVLVAAEVALALVLATGAGLLAKSLWNLTRVDAGIDAAQVLTFDLAPPVTRYREPERLDALYDALLARLRALPQVEVAALVNLAPLTGGFDGNSVTADDRPQPPPRETLSAQTRSVTPDYFRAMGIDVRRGRTFGDRDRAGATPVVVINQALASELWPDGDAIGKRITVAGASAEVIGVVSDVKHLSLAETAPPRVYAARSQAIIPWQLRNMTVVLRTADHPAGLAAVARAAVHEIDPQLPIAKLRTMEEVVTASVAPPRFRTSLLSSFAALALLLAAVGIYGVISYSASQRVREMAIRMALGARSLAVLRLMLGEGLAPVAIGLMAGVAAALVFTRLLSGFLFQVPPTDPIVFSGVALMMMVIAVAAILAPAWRATRVDPMRALQEE